MPNRYIQGSTVVINSENDTLMLNKGHNPDQIVDGSLWPVIPPGRSELEIVLSTWAKKSLVLLLNLKKVDLMLLTIHDNELKSCLYW